MPYVPFTHLGLLGREGKVRPGISETICQSEQGPQSTSSAQPYIYIEVSDGDESQSCDLSSLHHFVLLALVSVVTIVLVSVCVAPVARTHCA